jgi:tetratricopeptide (TPR) repeat protein
VDEIVVIDTGSSDATVEIARNFHSRVGHFPWTGDFSAARNHALEKSGCDWILYIDADERLSPGSSIPLREAVGDNAALALKVRFRPGVNFTRYHEIRLFRRDPRIRFSGAIHETIIPAIHAVAREDGRLIKDCAVEIDHVGYEGDLTGKFRRNIPLLEKAVETQPGRVYLWVDLARSNYGLGRMEEARKACRHAIELAGAADDSKDFHDGALAWQCLVSMTLESDPQEAAALAEAACRLYPGDPALRLARANGLYAAGGAEGIVPLLDSLLAIDAESFFDPMTAYDRRIFGEWAASLKGAVLARAGRRAEAAEAFRAAAAFNPADRSYAIRAVALSGKPA